MLLSAKCCLSSAFWLACLFGTFGKSKQEEGALPELFIFNELCAFKAEPGPCRAAKDKYFFNVDTGQCELFEYGGCQGNANNFETLEACQETCLVSDDKSPCHLQKRPGPCRGLVTRYFFDSSSQQCKRFFYGGCFGNANNFGSMALCNAKCQNQERVEVVLQNGAPDLGDVQPTSLTDEQTANSVVVQKNNSDPHPSQDSNLPSVCLSPVDIGPCAGRERRFAYNPETRRCRAFPYGGCEGNDNNFKTRRQCIRKCTKSQKDRGMKMIRMSKKNFLNILHGSV
ncbi:LOW QUALITY PROTEIN: tissue factor pathway inhibitor a [Nerophis ophidion]|uniref:LOW QUALITY PROTEIN: tissue factor pathway inhibitor a n=1 Tax=Nerophis ophidion TaxID=159077 RepID=UPI002AE012C7|nr:LOW QUALITY PROTEIN: tissue factor pathway inhibitor a [Nerophis ophidion]